MNLPRVQLTLPDLDVAPTPVIASLWLVDPGESVVEGDRVIEVLAGEATIDLPAPTTGVLVRVLVDEGERLEVGQLLGIFESESDD
jgi:pyruvate/2-oxoglutarate dehydrogenase complex dihydrolipoamide acyltransferase (E2) component